MYMRNHLSFDNGTGVYFPDRFIVTGKKYGREPIITPTAVGSLDIAKI